MAPTLRSLAVVVLVTLAATVPAAAQCEGISWEFSSGLLHVRHDARYNCAVRAFDHAVRLVDQILIVDEYAIAAGFADCICDYRTDVVIAGIDPTVTTLRFGFGERLVGEPPVSWTVCELPLTIAANDAADSATTVTLVESRSSGCGMAAGVPVEEPVPPISWDRFKLTYR